MVREAECTVTDPITLNEMERLAKDAVKAAAAFPVIFTSKTLPKYVLKLIRRIRLLEREKKSNRKNKKKPITCWVVVGKEGTIYSHHYDPLRADANRDRLNMLKNSYSGGPFRTLKMREAR